MIGVLDVMEAHIYWCENPVEAEMVKEMLEMLGKPFEDIRQESHKEKKP